MQALTSLSQSIARAEERVHGFRQMFGTVLVIETLFGCWLLFSSFGLFGLSVSDIAGIPPGLTGIMLLWSVLFQLTGFIDPVRNRVPVVVGVLGRYMVGVVAMLLGLLVVGLLFIAIGLALNFSYHATVRAIVQSRP